MAATLDIVYLNYGEEKRQTTTQEHPYGQLGMNRDGRAYRYIFMDGAVTAGKLLQTPANIAAHDMDLVTAIAAIGAITISVTLGATAIAADEYKDGYLYVNDLVGEGQFFKIDTHALVASSGTFAVPIRDEGGVRTALDATSLCGLMKNPWKDVIIAPTTFTGDVVGRTTRDMSDNNFGWAQRTGLAALLADGVPIIGQQLSRSNGVAGAVEPIVTTAGATGEFQTVAVTTLIAAVTTDYQICNMILPP